MATRRVVREGWQGYFDSVSRHLKTSHVEVWVEGIDIGDQLTAEHLPLLGLSYDPIGDQVRVITESIDHAISAPIDIYVEESEAGLESFEVKTSDGRTEIVRLTAALALPG